jgi:hypothetical protein
MSYATREDMKAELTEISVTRRDLSGLITKALLDNFTNKEIISIAQVLRVGNYHKLIELIKR